MIILILIIIFFIFCMLLINKKEGFSNTITLKEQQTKKIYLSIKKTNNYNLIYETENFCIWEPINIDQYIGTNQYITNSNKSPEILAVLVKSETNGMDRPKTFELLNVFDDEMKIWKIIPNKGYQGMGVIFSKDKPKVHQYRCVKDEFLLPDKLKKISYTHENVNIWQGDVSNSFSSIPKTDIKIKEQLFKYVNDCFKIDKKLKVKNINRFSKIAEFNGMVFWECEKINDYYSIGQIVYPIDKDPNNDNIIAPLVHQDHCKPISNYGEKLLSFIYNGDVYSIWRPVCYNGYGILSDIVVPGSEEPNYDINVYSVMLTPFINIKYGRTMDWNSINSDLNSIYSLWCNNNKYFHFTDSLDKPYSYDITIDPNNIDNDYDIMDKKRAITLSFEPTKTYEKYDENEIINLVINALSNRTDTRKSRFRNLFIKNNTIELDLFPKLKNINECDTKEICNNIKNLVNTMPIKVYINNRLDNIMSIKDFEEHYIPENIIPLDNSEAISCLS